MSKQPSHAISGVFVFLLLGIFAVFSTVLVLLGAKAYKGSADRAALHNDDRIAAAYVRSMVRSDDRQGAIDVKDLMGVTAIEMHFDYDGEPYVTRIYAYDGALREWFTEESMDFEPENGEMVCRADDMQAKIENGLLTVDILQGDQRTHVTVALRAGR